jgi:hypothetical protein
MPAGICGPIRSTKIERIRLPGTVRPFGRCAAHQEKPRPLGDERGSVIGVNVQRCCRDAKPAIGTVALNVAGVTFGYATPRVCCGLPESDRRPTGLLCNDSDNVCCSHQLAAGIFGCTRESPLPGQPGRIPLCAGCSPRTVGKLEASESSDFRGFLLFSLS